MLHDPAMVYPIARLTLLPLVRHFISSVHGTEHLPTSGPYILACKHTGPLDALFIASVIIPVIGKKIHFIARIAPWGWFWKKIVAERWAGCIPFEKSDKTKCIDTAKQYIMQNKVVGIFPSGILEEQRDTQDYRGRTGTARLALWTQVPVIPVGIRNFSTFNLLTMIKKHLARPGSMHVRIGQPMTFPDMYDRPITYDMLRDVTARIMRSVEKLSISI